MADATSRLIDEIKRREQQLSGVLNGLDDGLIVLGRDFKVVAANRSIATWLGSHPEALRGQECRHVTGHALPCCDDPECPDGALPRHRPPRAGHLPRARVGRRRRARLRDLRLAGLRRGRVGRAGRRGVARHHRPRPGRGASRRVRAPLVARHPGLRPLARGQHAARHDAHLRRRRSSTSCRRGGRPARRRRRSRRSATAPRSSATR